MKPCFVTLLTAVTLAWSWVPAEAQSLAQAFKRASPSVVVIRTTAKGVAVRGQAEPIKVVSSLGSGVLISSDGKVMTAAHLVQTADEITVQFLSGEVAGAKVVASEPEADVSLLQLERVPPLARAAKLGDSDRVEVGEQIFVVGAPYGIGYTLTVGHISGRRRPSPFFGGLSQGEFFQTDAAINPGNSGGPMFSMAGEVIGIVSHIISKSGGFEGLGFVITSNMARRLLLERKSFWTGLSGYPLRGNLAKVFNLPQPVGLLVQRVAERSPAAETGLRAGTMKAAIDGQTMMVGGDIILRVHGIPVTDDSSYEKIQGALSGLHSGAEVVVTVLREGQQLQLTWRVP